MDLAIGFANHSSNECNKKEVVDWCVEINQGSYIKL